MRGACRCGAGAVVAAAWLAGCAMREALPENLDAATTPLQAAEVFPDRPQEAWYDAAEAGGDFIVRSLEPVDAAQARVIAPVPDGAGASSEAGPGAPEIDSGLRVRSRIFEAGADPRADEPFEDMHLAMARAADGSILLIASRVGDRTTTFDPPIIYMPAMLGPGVPFEHESHAEVTGENGRRQTGGRAVRRLEYVGDESWAATSHPPAPPATLRVIRAELDLDLFPARVLSSSTFWVDRRGIVRERQVNRVWVLGVPTQTRRHDVILRGALARPDARTSEPTP